MPSFDIVSKIDDHEVTNAVDQSNREVNTRFDFKGSNASFEYNKDKKIMMKASNEFQVKQMRDILESKCAKRNIDLRSLDYKDIQTNGQEARQEVEVKQGIEQEMGKKITKMIKDQKLKVQASIQGEQVRVTGKKRDDLQEVIAYFRSESLELPLQFENFRD
jgi:uncharacterized protein YajQ (UPF0234 family)